MWLWHLTHKNPICFLHRTTPIYYSLFYEGETSPVMNAIKLNTVLEPVAARVIAIATFVCILECFAGRLCSSQLTILTYYE